MTKHIHCPECGKTMTMRPDPYDSRFWRVRKHMSSRGFECGYSRLQVRECEVTEVTR